MSTRHFLFLVASTREPGHLGNTEWLARQAAASLPACAAWEGADPARLAFALGIALFLAFTHRANLQRLRRGTESRFDRVRLFHRRRAGA